MKKYCEKPTLPQENDSEKFDGVKFTVRFQEFSLDLFGETGEARCANGKKLPIVQLQCIFPGIQFLINPSKANLNIIMNEFKVFTFTKNLSKYFPASGAENTVSRSRAEMHTVNAPNISASSQATARKMPEMKLSGSTNKSSISLSMPSSVAKSLHPSILEKRISCKSFSSVIQDRNSSVTQRCFLVMKNQNGSAFGFQCLFQEKKNFPNSISSELNLGSIALELDYSIFGDICEMLRPYRDIHCIRCSRWGKNQIIRGVIFDQKDNPNKILSPVETLQARELVQLDPTRAIDEFLDNKNASFILKTKEITLSLYESEKKVNSQIVEPEAFATFQTTPCQWVLKKEGGKTSVNCAGISFSTTKCFGFAEFFIKRIFQFFRDSTVSDFLNRYHRIYQQAQLIKNSSKLDRSTKLIGKSFRKETVPRQDLCAQHSQEIYQKHSAKPHEQHLGINKKYQQNIKEQIWQNIIKKGKEPAQNTEVEESEKPIPQPKTGDKIVRLSQKEMPELLSYNNLITNHNEFAPIRPQNFLLQGPPAGCFPLDLKQAKPSSKLYKENKANIMEVIDEPIPKVNRISRFQAFSRHKY